MEDTEPPSATSLPPGIQEELRRFIKTYGLDSVAQDIRDFCGELESRHGPDARGLTTEQKREARLWGFAKKSAERFLRDVLDHGPTSGCK